MRLKRDAQFRVTILALVLLLVILGVSIVQYHRIEREMCVTRLSEYTEVYGEQVADTLSLAQNYLSEIAMPIYREFQTSEDAGRKALSDYGDMDMISRLELLMPDGTLYDHLGKGRNPTLSYDTMAAQGVHVTHRTLDQQSGEHFILRVCCPVRQGSRTVAILCGVVKVERLGRHFPVHAYGGKATLSLLESDTGNYLVDSWHDTTGNLRDLNGYTFARGYSQEEYYRQIHTGESGLTVLRTPRSTETFYVRYAPVPEYPNWMVMLSVPENVAFAQSGATLLLFSIMTVLVLGLFFAYLFWFLRDSRLRQQRTEMRLKGAQYILDVQQTLFRAHAESEHFQEALEKVADYTSADVAVYFSVEADGQLIRHSVGGTVSAAPPKTADLRSIFPWVTKTALAEGRFISDRPFRWGGKDWQSAQSMGIRNMMLVRLDELDGSGANGLLCVINFDPLWDDTSPLDQVALVFTMAIENYRNYQTLSYLSQVDELTGLMNRNSYQVRLEELEHTRRTLSCIYIDVNGLHEINNHLGHDAGDEMLRSVADALRSVFERKDIFRLGGDEFAVLDLALPQDELERRLAKVTDTVEKCGYSISVGVARQTGDDASASEVVARAEATMRSNKAAYYADQGGERQMRRLNTRLEQTLTAKRDADVLLSYLAPAFKGVYFADPAKDTCRTVVAPPFFEEYLKETDGRFSGALKLYAERQLEEPEREKFLAFCHYDALLTQLKGKEGVELIYTKADGSACLLRVREPRRAGDNRQEIMWIFTEMPKQ